MDEARLLEVLRDAADEVRAALNVVTNWGPSGIRPGQYAFDVVADEAAVRVLQSAGLGVLSEESGLSNQESPYLVVLDPVDGSTNASRGIPWFSTSLCVVDSEGPLVALVQHQCSDVRFEAVRGGGATRDGRPLRPGACELLADAIVGVSGLPALDPGWSQFRALGAASLDICSVAEGVLDAYRVVGGTTLYGWDYLGALLLCSETGVQMADLDGRDLVVRDASARTPAFAATGSLLGQLMGVNL